MKRVLCFPIVILVSVFFTCQAQKTEEYKNWWNVVDKKNQSFQNGKINFDYSYRRKDSVDFKQKPYTCFFSKEITYQKKGRKVHPKFNIFDMKDSIQYIYDLNCLATINHKTKTFELDTSHYVTYYPYNPFSIFLPDMVYYYLENRFVFTGYYFDKQTIQIDSSIVFSYLRDRKSVV